MLSDGEKKFEGILNVDSGESGESGVSGVSGLLLQNRVLKVAEEVRRKEMNVSIHFFCFLEKNYQTTRTAGFKRSDYLVVTYCSFSFIFVFDGRTDRRTDFMMSFLNCP